MFAACEKKKGSLIHQISSDFWSPKKSSGFPKEKSREKRIHNHRNPPIHVHPKVSYHAPWQQLLILAWCGASRYPCILRVRLCAEDLCADMFGGVWWSNHAAQPYNQKISKAFYMNDICVSKGRRNQDRFGTRVYISHIACVVCSCSFLAPLNILFSSTSSQPWGRVWFANQSLQRRPSSWGRSTPTHWSTCGGFGFVWVIPFCKMFFSEEIDVFGNVSKESKEWS